MDGVLTVEELLEFCKEQVKAGNGKKHVILSGDDEGNSFHYLVYAFNEDVEGFSDNFDCFLQDANNENSIILG